jgi:hypothetical protein
MSKRLPEGFLRSPKKSASGNTYHGRFTCRDVQWTGSGSDALATFTATADEIADAAEGRLTWTDQDVQRGILPGITPRPSRELALCDGYPNPGSYVFDAANADDMVEKLLSGSRLFLSPLVWNLRPGQFQAYWSDKAQEIYIYEGRVFLPDSHHRQQAILKAVRALREAPAAYPKFSGDRQFKVELYFLSREDEGNYFFDKNQRPKPVAKSKAFDLTTLDDLSLLAKNVISRTESLRDNVNRVTDRLGAKNPQVITLSTLREMMRTVAPTDELDSAELEGIAQVAAAFYDMLAVVRPELGVLDRQERRRVRNSLVVDAAVMMHGYAYLMRDFNSDIAAKGRSASTDLWRERLAKLAASNRYELHRWSGDLFDKANPLWKELGVVKPSREGRSLTVLNTGGARAACGRVLRHLTGKRAVSRNLQFLLEE